MSFSTKLRVKIVTVIKLFEWNTLIDPNNIEKIKLLIIIGNIILYINNILELEMVILLNTILLLEYIVILLHPYVPHFTNEYEELYEINKIKKVSNTLDFNIKGKIPDQAIDFIKKYNIVTNINNNPYMVISAIIKYAEKGNFLQELYLTKNVTNMYIEENTEKDTEENTKK